MSLCGKTEQTKPIAFNIVDNRKRDGVKVKVLVHLEYSDMELDVETLDEPYVYRVSWTQDHAGVNIMEVFFDDEQVPQSPFRVQISDRQCEVEFPGERRSNTDEGACECSTGSMEIRGRCVGSTIIAVLISAAAVLVIALFGSYYVKYKTNKNDEMWKVEIDDIQVSFRTTSMQPPFFLLLVSHNLFPFVQFNDPVEVIGQGSFGTSKKAELSFKD